MMAYVHFVNLRLLAETLLAGHLLGRLLPHREHYALRMVGSTLLCLLLAFFFPVTEFADRHVIVWGTGMYTALFFIAAGGLAACYEESFSGIFWLTICAYTMHQLSSGIADLLEPIPQSLGISPLLSTVPLCIAFVYRLCWRALSPGIRRAGCIRMDNRRLPFLSAAVLMVDIVTGLIQISISSQTPMPAYEMLITLLNVIACVFILYMQYGFLSNRRLETELAVVSQMLEEEKRQYENARSNIDIINQKCHDLKHQIRTVRHRPGEVDRSVLKEIEQAVEMYDTSTDTGNAALDVILTEKKLLCESRGVTLTCIADGSGLERISPPDIYALFGNALDNALEAVSSLTDPEARGISLSVRRSAGMTILHTENRFPGDVSFREGIPQTSKGDTASHGYGVRSMKTIAEKYGGCLTASAADGIFSLTVTLLE